VTIKLTHAGLNIPIYINTGQLFGFYWSKTANHTILFSTGTTTIPVKESLNEIEAVLKEVQQQASQPQQQVRSLTEDGEAT
jgi:hypothetical protein